VLKDPLALRYFQLGEEEHFVWNLLTGRVTLAALCQAFTQRFAPRQLSLEEAQRFVGQLIQQGLVVGDVPGSATATEKRRDTQQRLRRWSQCTNVLAIRFRGVDPDRWLSRLLPWCGGIFSPTAAVLGGLLILSALLLWLTHAAEFAHRWPEEVAQWTVTDLASLALVLAGVKVLHELGHGLACKRFGGEVHELGMMLLVFTPCLYCNVSDAWLLPSRWRRIVISAAGMWVEAVLASLAAWLWWLSEPGWFHGLCLQVIFICGLSTLVFNLNPLLRYDGYFILSDLWDVPNLAQQASAELRRTVWRWLTGEELPAPPATTGMRFWLAAYAAASLVYRLLVLAVILWAVYHWLEPQGLGVLAQTIAGVTLLTLLMGPLMQVWQTARDPERHRSWRGLLAPRPLLILTALTAVLFVPLPRRVPAPVLIEPAEARGLFVTIDGRLDSLVPAGTVVSTGDAIARLSNPDLERRLERIDGELATALRHAEGLERRQIVDPNAGLLLPAALQTCRDLEQQREQLQADVERLVIRAPQDGVVWPMPGRPSATERDQLPTWTGSPFDPHNAGAWLTAGTQLGWIGPADRFEATAYVPQRDIARVTVGGPVRVLSDAQPESPLSGTIREIAAAQTAGLSTSVAQRLKLPQVGDAQSPRLVGRWYQVRIPLEPGPLPTVTRTAGWASISVPPESLFARAVGWLRETFPSVMR
jgi:putative peptide zinc metalloprotease protein